MVAVRDGVGVVLPVVEAEPVAVADAVSEPVSLAERVAVPVNELDALPVPLALAVGDGEVVWDELGVAVCELDAVAV